MLCKGIYYETLKYIYKLLNFYEDICEMGKYLNGELMQIISGNNKLGQKAFMHVLT